MANLKIIVSVKMLKMNFWLVYLFTHLMYRVPPFCSINDYKVVDRQRGDNTLCYLK